MKIKSRLSKIFPATILLSSSIMGITCSAEYMTGQVKAPIDFFLFEDSTGGYLCFNNQYGTYTIGESVDMYVITPQIDWFSDGKWNYSEDWDDVNIYSERYLLENNNLSDFSGNIKIFDNNKTMFFGDTNLPEKMRVRYITMYVSDEESGFSTEIGEWSEEIDLSSIEKISLDNYNIDAPIICGCNKTEEGYSLNVRGGANFLKMYSLPNYKLAMYIEGKGDNSDWSNLMSVIPMGESENYIINIPDDSNLKNDTNLKFRCKYGIVYNGNTIYSPWSDTSGEGVAVEDADFVSNGDAVFIPRENKPEEATTESKTSTDTKAEESQNEVKDNNPLLLILGAVFLVVLTVFGVVFLRKKKR